ncbi:hypothetical protein FD723_39685 (plasmid) [Nostoc sp. C052]|uniref:hypothetical protein n=1 Tax=Nostoc sp. C052 TaxID=2576902 RepID=UPI0015C3A338|nr:hypothetical protein [Nostoc sp. C052]QLE46334.1 hypothetical protein FD723_39685 [Nostoc sp. C052]
MLVKEFKSLIAIECDRDDSNNNPVLLELKPNKTMWITYSYLNILSKRQISCDLEGEWTFATTLDKLKELMGKAKGTNEISFAIEKDVLLIKISKDGKGNEMPLASWGAKPEFNLDEFDGDDQLLVISLDSWKEMWLAGQVVVIHNSVSTKKSKQDVMSSHVRLDVSDKSGFVTGYSPGIICHRQFMCEETLSKNRTFLVPISLVAMVTTLKFSPPAVIKLRMSADFKTLLTKINDNYYLTDIPSVEDYPILDGIVREKQDSQFTVTINNKNRLVEALQTAHDAGIKNATLIFDNGHVTVESGNSKVPSVSVPASAEKNFTSTVKLSVTLLLDALKAINVAKILLLFPITAGKALIIETLTGIVYVILAIAKVVTHILDSAPIADKPEPRTEEVETGKTLDNKSFVVEAVEENPLPPLDGKTPDERLAQAEMHLVEIRETIEAFKKSTITPEILQQLGDLEMQLEEALGESQRVIRGNTLLVSSGQEYSLDDLDKVSLRMYWLGGRTLNIIWHKETTWKLEIRIINPLPSTETQKTVTHS